MLLTTIDSAYNADCDGNTRVIISRKYELMFCIAKLFPFSDKVETMVLAATLAVRVKPHWPL